jgi:hypothetical protein
MRNDTRRLWTLAAALVLASSACTSDAPGDGGKGSDSSSDTMDGIFTVTNDEEDSSSSGGGAADTSTGEPGQLNCEKIDFVFVIDNSTSMVDEQQNLVDAVPGFVESMRTALPSVKSFRVGVVDTDSYPGLGTTEAPLDGCPAEGADCSSCDYQLGAFATKPLSAIDPASSCNFSTGASYMEGAAESFPEEFACAAIVGADGNPVEQQTGALLAAIDPASSADGACNAGFLRDDALLVFLMISDEEDDHTDMPAPQGGTLGEPSEWYDAVVAAKNGRAANVVGLGLIGGSPRFDDCIALSANGQGAEQTSRLDSFLNMFDTHFEGSVCSPTYGAFFDDALAKVAQGCMNFIP